MKLHLFRFKYPECRIVLDIGILIIVLDVALAGTPLSFPERKREKIRKMLNTSGFFLVTAKI